MTRNEHEINNAWPLNPEKEKMQTQIDNNIHAENIEDERVPFQQQVLPADDDRVVLSRSRKSVSLAAAV